MSRAVVVGGGHNGAVAALALARRGLEVTLVEPSDRLGGCLWPEVMDSGHRLERGAVEHAGLVPVAAELGLDAFGLRFATREVSVGTIVASHASRPAITIPADLDEAVAAARADGAGYRRLADLAARLFGMLDAATTVPTPTGLAATLAHLPGGDDLFRLLCSSAETVIDAHVADPVLRAALRYHAGHAQTPPWAAGTGLFALLLPGSHAAPPARPVGGSTSVLDALEGALAAAGATARTGVAVTGLRDLDGRAEVALRDRDGAREVIDADVVVSTLDVRRTAALFDDPPGQLSRAAAAVRSGALNVAELKVDLAFSSPPSLGHVDVAPGAMWYVHQRPDDLRRVFAELLAGRLPQRPAVMWTAPHAEDPDAPPTGWLSTFVPLRPDAGRWTEALEEQAVVAALDTLRVATGAELAPVSVVVTGPRTWQDRLGSPDGNPNHLDLSLDQLLGWRPPGLAGHRTDLGWLYLSGAGTHPGGGLTGVPALRAADAVLADLATPRARRPVRAVATRVVDELRGLRAGLALYREIRRLTSGLSLLDIPTSHRS